MEKSWNNINLFERQIKPAEILLKQRSLLLDHTPGSGKTYAALYAVDILSKEETLPPNVSVIAPAKVVTEVWLPIIAKLSLSNLFTVISYELAKSRLSSILSSIEHNKKAGIKQIVICDEVHVVRNTNTKGFHAVFAIASKAYKLILLTGTPLINTVDDAVALLRLLKNDGRINFKPYEFVDPMTLRPHNLAKFKNMFHGLVHFYELSQDEVNYPKKIEVTEVVNMYPLQKLRYHDFMTKFLSPTLRQLMESGIITNALNPFLVRTRAISNTIGKYKLEGEVDDYEQSEKFIGIKKAILDGPKPVVIYSFFLANGVVAMKKFLDSTTSLTTALIAGSTKEKDINKHIKDFYNRRIDVLLVTSALRQGVEFKGARQLHKMDPPWNEDMDNQIDSRVFRYGSHTH